MLPAVLLLHLAELGEACGKGQGIAAERSGLIDRTVRCEHVHDVCATTEGSDGQAAADDLAERREVRHDAFLLLHPTLGHAEAGHDFVKDEQGTMLLGDLAELLQETGLRQDQASIGGITLHDDSGYLVALLRKAFFERGDIIVGKHGGQRRIARWDARAVRLTVRERSASGGDKQGIDVSMIAAVELHDAISFGEATGKAHTAHRGLRAAVHHAHFFNTRHPINNGLGHLNLIQVRRAEADPVLRGIVHGFDDALRRVSQNGRTPCPHVVDHGTTIDILHPATLGPADKKGITTYIAEGANRRVHPTGNDGFGFGEELRGEGGIRHGQQRIAGIRSPSREKV